MLVPHILQGAFINRLGEVRSSCEGLQAGPTSLVQAAWRPAWRRHTRCGTEDSPSQGGHWHVRGIGAGLKGS